MENKKLSKYKEKFQDKNLNFSQRQKLMEEVYIESRKPDERKPLSLYKHKTFMFWGFFLSFVFKLSDLLLSHSNIEKYPVADFITMILTFICAIGGVCFLVIYFVAYVEYKVDIEDELAKENLTKARNILMGITVGLLLIAYVAIENFNAFSDVKTINIKILTISDIIFLGIMGYFSFESALFIYFEGKSNTDEEEES